MTDDELDAIEHNAAVLWLPTPTEEVLALVAEVRRLRGAFLTLADELDAEGQQPWRPGHGEEPAYYHGLSDAASDIRKVASP